MHDDLFRYSYNRELNNELHNIICNINNSKEKSKTYKNIYIKYNRNNICNSIICYEITNIFKYNIKAITITNNGIYYV